MFDPKTNWEESLQLHEYGCVRHSNTKKHVNAMTSILNNPTTSASLTLHGSLPQLIYKIPIMTSPHSKKHNQSQSPICDSYRGREILPTQTMHFFQGNSCKMIIQFASSLVIPKWVPFFMIPELWLQKKFPLKQPCNRNFLGFGPVKGPQESLVPHSSRGSGSCHTHFPPAKGSLENKEIQSSVFGAKTVRR